LLQLFLLPQGEGQDEGIYNEALSIDPLTPTLSREERELTGKQLKKYAKKN